MLRPKLVELLEMTERLYERALEGGNPAVDASWLREELDVPDPRRAGDASHPPPLGHERMAELVPGLGELAHTIAERVGDEPGHCPSRSIERDELLRDLGFQRFVREHARRAVERHPTHRRP